MTSDMNSDSPSVPMTMKKEFLEAVMGSSYQVTSLRWSTPKAFTWTSRLPPMSPRAASPNSGKL